MIATDLPEEFGSIDIYLFDQLLQQRIIPAHKILDAGCGGGRNLVFLLREGFEVYGVDKSPPAIDQTRSLAAHLAPQLPANNFRVETVESMSFEANSFDVVISSAVLHFARDEAHWQSMVREMWRVLKPSGLFFARLASTVGMADEIKPIQGRRFHLPDGSIRFLVDEEFLVATADALGGQWLEPFKTVVVAHQRAMSNWVLRKLS